MVTAPAGGTRGVPRWVAVALSVGERSVVVVRRGSGDTGVALGDTGWHRGTLTGHTVVDALGVQHFTLLGPAGQRRGDAREGPWGRGEGAGSMPGGAWPGADHAHTSLPGHTPSIGVNPPPLVSAHPAAWGGAQISPAPTLQAPPTPPWLRPSIPTANSTDSAPSPRPHPLNQSSSAPGSGGVSPPAPPPTRPHLLPLRPHLFLLDPSL